MGPSQGRGRCLRRDSPWAFSQQPGPWAPALPYCSWCLCVADSLGGGSEGPCFCPTPCNLTRYGKEISMVRIPNRGSARYLARKYNRNETYIRCVCARVCARACSGCHAQQGRRLVETGRGCIFLGSEAPARAAFHNPFLLINPYPSSKSLACPHLRGGFFFLIKIFINLFEKEGA